MKGFKNLMISPSKEILINKVLYIKGIKSILMSITKEKNKNRFWIMSCIKSSYNNIDKKHLTNKEEMINNICSNLHSDIFISSLEIQNKTMTFSSSCGINILNDSIEGGMYLQHFLEKGIDISVFENENPSNIFIYYYEQKRKEKFPKVELSKDLNIVLNIEECPKEILVNKDFKLSMGEGLSKEKICFYDGITNVNRYFYINNVYEYDIWKEAENYFNNISMLSKEKIDEIKNEYFENLKDLCPENMNLAVIEYETVDDVQLNFYDKEFLNKEPKNRDSLSVMFLKPKDEIGPNGYKNRLCILRPVSKGFNGSIEVELFSWVMVTQKEIIKV